MNRIKYYVFKHKGSGASEVLMQCEEEGDDKRDMAYLKLMLGHQYEPTFLIVKGEIDPDKKKRKPGVWQYGKGSVVYFTCPWCGRIQTTGRSHVGEDIYESIWCGYGVQPGCHRHLMNLYIKDLADPRLVYLEGNKKE